MRRFLLFLAGCVGFMGTLWVLSGSGDMRPPFRFYLWSGLMFMAAWAGLDFVRGWMARRVTQADQPSLEEQKSSEGSQLLEGDDPRLGVAFVGVLGSTTVALTMVSLSAPFLLDHSVLPLPEHSAPLLLEHSVPPPLEHSVEKVDEVWGANGHRVVCAIAWDLMEDQSQAAVAEVLGIERHPAAFADSCVWADEIRAQLSARPPHLAHLNPYTPAHYVNFPKGLAKITRSGCTKGSGATRRTCVIDAIDEMVEVLLGAESELSRAEALRFLTHFVGDIHQPLHVAYGDDRGGNDTPVSVMGNSRNLHWVWDRFFVDHTGEEWSEMARRLREGVTSGDRQRWSGSDPLLWAGESYDLVESIVYAELARSEGYVGEDFYARNASVAEARLVMAGVRLAQLLNRVMDPQGADLTDNGTEV